MLAFVRFELLQDEVYFAKIEPDFNVLPLIRKHFKERYADQKWMIFDLKRHYGIFYDLKEVQFSRLILLNYKILEILNNSITRKRKNTKRFGNVIL
ncbi:MAG: DUF4130 domain-containing protein [Cloacibacterium normanense]